jgi:hypothetical protein
VPDFNDLSFTSNERKINAHFAQLCILQREDIKKAASVAV